MKAPSSRFVCSGCGRALPEDDPRPWRCPGALLDDDVDHVLVRELGDEGDEPVPFDGEAGAPGEDGWAQPFVRFRGLLHGWRFARRAGMSDEAWIELALELDQRVAERAGRGFRTTPLRHEGRLAGALAEPLDLVVKDETAGVAGTHVARQLFGLALHVAALERLGLERRPAPLAFAGNVRAALAAAHVARALERPLLVLVSAEAEAGGIERLRELGATVERCARREAGATADPCLARLRALVRRGALPFTPQGSENGLALEGAATLGWEIVRALEEEQAAPLASLFVQVGGGALASALACAWRDLAGARARRAGGEPQPGWSGPRLFPVQVDGRHPLARAWRILARGALSRAGLTMPAGDAGLAQALERLAGAPPVEAELAHAALHRSSAMWPWEVGTRSAAGALLESEAHDWHAVVRATFASGGWPVLADEETLEEALRLARHATGSSVSASGAAGLAGCLALRRSGIVPPGPIGLVFSGRA